MKSLLRFLIALITLHCGYLGSAQAQTPPPAPTTTASPATNSPQASTTDDSAIDPAKAAEIRKLLELTGTAKIMDQMKAQIITMFKRQRPNVSDEVWTHLDQDMDTNALLEKMLPLYDKYYTLDDLKAVNAFYESPAGQRMVAANPQIMQESMQIGQEWGRDVGKKVEEEIKKQKAKETPSILAPTSATPPPAPPVPSAPSTPPVQ